MVVEMDGWMEVGDRKGHLWGAAGVEQHLDQLVVGDL